MELYRIIPQKVNIQIVVKIGKAGKMNLENGSSE